MPIHSVCVFSSKNGYDFPPGVIRLSKYRIDLNARKPNTKKIGHHTPLTKKYLIELEEYDGFAMIKYYPHHLKKDKNRYRQRGLGKPEGTLGYFVPRGQMLKMMHECATIMKEYLAKRKFRFVGFIGMVDVVDNNSSKINSQRYGIYTPFVYSTFNENEYVINGLGILKNMNCLMITKRIDRNGLSKNQKKNYKKFNEFIIKNISMLPDIMTATTITTLLEELEESNQH